jgi:hypothetical protein
MRGFPMEERLKKVVARWWRAVECDVMASSTGLRLAAMDMQVSSHDA